MRQKDFEQAIVLEEKIALHLELLLNRQGSHASAEQLSPGVNTFLSSFGTYRDLVLDDCDPIEIWKRTLIAVQDISQLASSLYTAATGLPLSRSFSSVGERQSELFISPTLPKRAETFGGFDERRNKASYILPSRDAVLSTLSPGYFSNRDQNEKRESNASEFDSVSCYGSSTTNLGEGHAETATNEMLKDSNYAALQVSHNLHTLLCIISQQMTTIQSLQSQLNNYRENPKTMYRHNDQLEELRNLQDRLQEEKTAWIKRKEIEERDLDEERQKQKVLQEQIKKEQQDIQEQREQLYRKMEMLSNQGLLISPNVSIPVNQVTANISSETDGQSMSAADEHHSDDRRKDRWKPAPGELQLDTFPLESFNFVLWFQQQNHHKSIWRMPLIHRRSLLASSSNFHWSCHHWASEFVHSHFWLRKCFFLLNLTEWNPRQIPNMTVFCVTNFFPAQNHQLT